MSKEVMITTVKIKIGNKEVELTTDECRRLREALDGMFDAQVVHVHHDHWYWRNWQPVYQPMWGTVTCGSMGGGNDVIASSAQLCMNLNAGGTSA